MSANARLQIIIDASDRTKGAFSGVEGALKNLGTSGKSAGQALGSMAADVAKVGAVIGGAVVAGVGKAVSVFADFEHGMSAVKAASGATAGEMEQLSAAAIALGQDTSLAGIGATDAAEAMAELAKGGVSVADQLGGATKGALLLASAGAISVGEASSIATKAMNIFGLSGAEVAHVADLMSAGANKSATDVGQLGAAFNQSAAVAKNAGLSIEELTGTLAFLAQRGLEGSDAGTSLKTALLALQAPTDKAAGLMEELGINVRDAEGHMLPFADIADVLKDRLSGLSDAQRDAALKTIFGNDAIRVGIALYEGGGSAIRDWTKNVDDAGNAARTGATKNDNLKGSLDQLKAVFETAAIQVGAKFAPAIRTAADELGKFVTKAMASPEVTKALEDLGNKGSAALTALIAKLSDPAFQAGAKALATAFLDVGKAVVGFGQQVGNILGPAVEAAGLLFGALDSGGRRNVVMFGLVAAAALRYQAALGTLIGVVRTTIGQFAAKEAAKASLTKANDALAGSAGRTAISFGAVGTAAAAVGLAMIPLAILAGNVADKMNDANTATKKIAQSIGGDLGGAIDKIQATNWEESLIQTFTGHAAGAERANKAVHDWAQGIGGAAPTAAELARQIEALSAANADLTGQSTEDVRVRGFVIKALQEEYLARVKLDHESQVRDAYLTSEANAANDAAFAAKQHAKELANTARGYANVTAEAQALGQVVATQDPAVKKLVENYTKLGGALTGAAVATRATGLAAASIDYTKLIADQAAAAQQAGFYAGQVGLLQGGLDRLNGILQAGRPLSAAQSVAYDQAAHAAATYQIAIEGLTNSQFTTAVAASQVDAANRAAIQRMAVLTGAGNDVAASLQGQASHYVDLVAAVESANSALRVAAQTHGVLGSEISDFQGRVAALTQQEKDYAAGKAGVAALTAEEAAQLGQLKGLLPGLEEAYRAQAVQVTNLEIAQVLATAAVEESRKAFQGQNQALVATGVGIADAALKAGTLTQAQHDLAVAAITSADNAFALTNAINGIPGTHVTHFTIDAAGALVGIDQYGKNLFKIPPAYQTAIANNASTLIPLMNDYGETFLRVPADWVTNIQNNAGEETPVVDVYGRTVAQIPKEWATTFAHNAGELIPVVDEYGKIVKLVPRDQATTFVANTAGAQTAVNEFGQTIIKLPSTKTVTIKVELDKKMIASGIDSALAEATGMIGGGAGGAIPPVVIQVTANTAPAVASIAAVALDAGAFGKLTPTAALGITDNATAPIGTIKGLLFDYAAANPLPVVGITDQATTPIAGIKAKLLDYGALAPSPVAALTDNATAPINAVTALLQAYGKMVATAVAALLDNASGPINAVIGAINSVPRSFTVTAYVDISQALGAIATLNNNMPRSPAKEGPFRTLPNWDALFESFPGAVQGALGQFQKFGAGVKQALNSLALGTIAQDIGGGGDGSVGGIMRLFAANFEVALDTMKATASAAGDFLAEAQSYKSLILLAVTAIREAQAALNTVNFGGGGLPGPQAAGQGLGDGITKGIKKSLDIHSPSQVMAQIGRDVVDGLVQGMSDAQQDAAKKAADVASAVAKAITDTLGAATALGKLDLATLPTGGQITGILAFTRALVAEMAASSTILNEDGIKQTSLFSDAASKVASAVTAGLTALTALVSFVAPATSAIFAFGKSLRSAVNDLTVLAEQIPLELATAAAAFSEQATKAIGIFGAAVGGFTSLIGFVPPTDRAIYLFDQSVRAAINDLAYLAEQVTLETSDLASKFADGVTKALGVFGVGIDAFTKLHDYEGVTDRAIFDFNKSIKAFIEDFAIVAEKVTLETATLAGKFADGAGKAIAVVGTALSSFSGLAAFVTPGKTAVDGLLATVRYIIARFGEMAQTMSTEGTKQLGDFGAATNAVLGGVKSAIDTFLALDKATVPQTGDLSDLVVAVQGVTTNMAAAAKLLGDDAIKDATAFGSAANGIFSALKAGLDLFAMIDKPGGWPTTDWLQPLIELMGGMLSRGGALLSQAQQLKAVADQFNATMAGAYAGFATGLGGGGLTLTGNLGGGLAGGGGGAPTTINNYTVTGNTLLSKDTATQQMVSGIVTTQQSRTIGYSTSG